MKKIVKANVEWTDIENGGRKHILPVGMRYCPHIVFEAEQKGDTVWSAEIYNTEINGRTSTADLSYLLDNAPFHLLETGRKFFLYEGQRVVAEGIVC